MNAHPFLASSSSSAHADSRSIKTNTKLVYVCLETKTILERMHERQR